MFTIVGERINTSRKDVNTAVEKRDADYIRQDVLKQREAGAHYIDVNAGTRIGLEAGDVEWLIGIIQEAVDAPLCIDSADPDVLEKAFRLVARPPVINSISLEKKRYDQMIRLLKGKDCMIVALCMSDEGMPKTFDEVIGRAGRLIEGLAGIGMPLEKIYIDPLIQPVSTDAKKGLMTIQAVRGIMEKFPGVHTICGLSNVSYGMPERRVINRAFLSLLMGAGLDSAILDPLDRKIMTVVRASRMLLGDDPFCRDFIKAVRAGLIEA